MEGPVKIDVAVKACQSVAGTCAGAERRIDIRYLLGDNSVKITEKHYAPWVKILNYRNNRFVSKEPGFQRQDQ